MTRRTMLGAVVGAVALGSLPAAAAEPVRIGEINSYSRIPAFLLSSINGCDPAADCPHREVGFVLAVVRWGLAGNALRAQVAERPQSLGPRTPQFLLRYVKERSMQMATMASGEGGRGRHSIEIAR